MALTQKKRETVDCVQCDVPMVASRGDSIYEPVRGLKVTLKNVELRRCPKCRELEVVIPKIAQLDRAIAVATIQKKSSLDPAEVKFLRKMLGWSGEDFARRMGVRRESVSRWETGREQMGPVADRLLRLMVVTQEPVRQYPLDLLAEIERTKKRLKLAMRVRDSEWEAVAA